MSISLYLHLPFCRHICPYCDFTRQVYNEALVDRYLEKLLKEIPPGSFKTVYIGGGTPSCLSFKQLESLLVALRGRCQGEYTIEANVEDITEPKLVLLKQHGVNRLSLGVQSFAAALLASCGRRYNGKQALVSCQMVAQYFDNYSLDLIYGLPQQTVEDFAADLRQALALKVPHLSLYALTIEENSVWGKKQQPAPAEDLLADMYALACRLLPRAYRHYEISNFALPGYQAQHNLVYWHYEDFYGCGWGASGKEGRLRYKYDGSLRDYLENSQRSVINLTEAEARFEYLMMNLRLEEGLNYVKFRELFACDFQELYQEALQRNRDYFNFRSDGLSIKKEYFYISNSLLVDFLE